MDLVWCKSMQAAMDDLERWACQRAGSGGDGFGDVGMHFKRLQYQSTHFWGSLLNLYNGRGDCLPLSWLFSSRFWVHGRGWWPHHTTIKSGGLQGVTFSRYNNSRKVWYGVWHWGSMHLCGCHGLPVGGWRLLDASGCSKGVDGQQAATAGSIWHMNFLDWHQPG